MWNSEDVEEGLEFTWIRKKRTLEASSEGLLEMQIRENPLFNSLITTWIKWIKDSIIYTLLLSVQFRCV